MHTEPAMEDLLCFCVIGIYPLKSQGLELTPHVKEANSNPSAILLLTAA